MPIAWLKIVFPWLLLLLPMGGLWIVAQCRSRVGMQIMKPFQAGFALVLTGQTLSLAFGWFFVHNSRYVGPYWFRAYLDPFDLSVRCFSLLGWGIVLFGLYVLLQSLPVRSDTLSARTDESGDWRR